MKHLSIVVAALLALAGCGKSGVNQAVEHLVGNWAQYQLPEGCRAKQIAVENDQGIAVLCEDGRVFH